MSEKQKKQIQQMVDLMASAGYEKDQAYDAMCDELATDATQERERQVRQMVTNSRLEGIEPSQRDRELHQAYIAGTATLDDLHNHAIEYALEHTRDDGKAAKDHLAAGRWISYQNDQIAPDALLREWPDGRMEVIAVDEQGHINVVRTLPTKQEMKKRREALSFATASVELSGLKPSKDWQAKAEKFVTGQLTRDEFFNDLDHGPAA